MSRVAIFLEVEKASVLIVGAGPVGARRARSMLDCGAIVRVVATRVGPEMAVLTGGRNLEILERQFCLTDVAGACLVLACTDDLAVQRACALAAAERGIPCVAADRDVGARASLGAILRRGALTVAVSTGGESPALSAYVRDLLARWIGSHYGEASLLLSEFRARARTELLPVAERRQLAGRALQQGLLGLLEAGDTAAARQLLEALHESGVGREEPEQRNDEPWKS
ncbi:MAG: precorrin-2 dehydrogenase/sirohydrochlorin ferrochelatase [Hyphomicrobiaceae bacterium]|jgi:precorrin-2 dehydrogenase/sirohydrochlorin ferrochelatase